MVRVFVFLMVAIATAAYAQQPSISTDIQTLCIFSAAEKLPRIPGLAIVSTKTEPIPEELAKKTKTDTGAETIIVILNVTAAGRDASFPFVCVTGPGKPAFTTVLPISSGHK